MLARIFKKATLSKPAPALPPAISKLNEMGTRSAFCTVVERPLGGDVHEEVGPAMLYSRPGKLYARDGYLYLAPPAGYRSTEGLLRGEGERLNLRFHHQRVPYSLACRAVQRVRFSDRLLELLEPRAPIGYKLLPLGPVVKNESRRSLRFSHIRGGKGPHVFPHFRFDLFVERVRLTAEGPEIHSYPGDDPVPAEARSCQGPREMIALFHRILRTNPEHLRDVQVTRVDRDARSGRTDLAHLGAVPVLGLDGEADESSIHIRRPEDADQRSLKDGDLVVLQFIGRTFVKSIDVHYRWLCRVHRPGMKVVALRPKGVIQQQTGVPVVVRDFSVNGVGIQNSPLLETYLLNDSQIPGSPEALRQRLTGTGLLMHFYPRLFFPTDVESYRPDLPASIPVIGEIVRAHVDEGKDEGRISTLGVAFKFDPVDYDPVTSEVAAWEPLRALRENPHFKEIHRALNGLMAFLER
jgi:hypothetical protein